MQQIVSDVQEFLIKTNLLCNLRLLDKSVGNKLLRSHGGGFCFGYSGTLNVSSRMLEVKVAFDKDFPASLPHFFLNDLDWRGSIPHIEIDGYICYVQREEVMHDQDDIQGTISECFKIVTKLLDDGLRRTNRIDFLNEFEAYWTNCIDQEFPVALLDTTVDDSPRMLRVFSSKGKLVLLCGVEKASYHLGQWVLRKLSEAVGIFVPLKTEVFPPADGKAITVNYVLKLINERTLMSDRKRIIDDFTFFQTVSKRLFVVFAFFQPSGNWAVFAVVLDRKKLFPPTHEVRGMRLQRVDYEFIAARGNESKMLKQKKILIAGCGSVGGYIASQMSKVGVGQLILVDPDCLGYGNTVRHHLGAKYVGCSKVRGLKEDIESSTPHIRVEAREQRIQDLFKEDLKLIKECDLLIFAIGNPTLEIKLNRLVHKLDCPPTVFSWVEPYGIGGHAILTNNEKKPGCYECLYPRENGSLVANRCAFARNDTKPFSKSASGCGSVYTPYGSLASLRTAILACEIAVSVLSGNEKDNPLFSWKGKSEKFEEEGFETTKRFSKPQELLDQDRYSYKRQDCSVCGMASKEYGIH